MYGSGVSAPLPPSRMRSGALRSVQSSVQDRRRLVAERMFAVRSRAYSGRPVEEKPTERVNRQPNAPSTSGLTFQIEEAFTVYPPTSSACGSSAVSAQLLRQASTSRRFRLLGVMFAWRYSTTALLFGRSRGLTRFKSWERPANCSESWLVPIR